MGGMTHGPAWVIFLFTLSILLAVADVISQQVGYPSLPGEFALMGLIILASLVITVEADSRLRA